MRKVKCTNLIAVVLFMSPFLTLNVAVAAQRQESSVILGGTVNVALGNANGLVVLTDSRQTLTDSTGQQRPDPTEAQKLIVLDDRSVCAVAGFGTIRLPTAPQFNVGIMGILAQVRDDFVGRPQTFNAKLLTISNLVQFYISAVANLNEYQPHPVPSRQYFFALYLAGYDLDGNPKIGRLELTGTPQVLNNGKADWSFTRSITVEPVGPGITGGVQGIWDIGEQILSHPEQDDTDAAVHKYSESMRADSGASLTIGDMEALAVHIAQKTSDAHPAQVGGSLQVCILQNGKIQQLKQPTFPPPERPFPFILVNESTFDGKFSDIIKSTAPRLFVRCTFLKNPTLDIDKDFFVDSDIRDATVYYDGGDTFFDPSNRVTNSVLILGPHANWQSSIVRELVTKFQWVNQNQFPKYN